MFSELPRRALVAFVILVLIGLISVQLRSPGHPDVSTRHATTVQVTYGSQAACLSDWPRARFPQPDVCADTPSLSPRITLTQTDDTAPATFTLDPPATPGSALDVLHPRGTLRMHPNSTVLMRSQGRPTILRQYR